ncbi:nucleoside triphosphate pyrophosphohydrolase [bacterium]|nr:nucleoside triphosphate pyrophosphohydrolase [bacterium]
MRYFKFNKLVRDKIVDDMGNYNIIPYGIKVLNDKEYIKELSRKIIEEAKELNNISSIEDLKEELADVQEVIDCLKKVLKMNNKDIEKYQKKKIKKFGAFKKRTYIEYVGSEQDNKWINYYLENPDKYPEIKNK